MKAVRTALYPLRLVAARLGRRSAAVVLVVLGIAAGAAVLLGGRAGTVIAQDRAVAQAVERIPDGSRSVRAVWFGVPGQSDEPQPVLERRARAALAHTGVGRASALVLYRESTLAGVFAGLGGVEGLGAHVRLRSGRLPRTCTPERCEVLRLRGSGRVPQPEGLRLVEVGQAVLESRVLFGDFLAPTDNALEQAEVSPAFARAAGYHRPAPPPLFLAEGVATLAGAPALETYYRSYAWVAPLRAGTPRLWQVDGLAAGVSEARSELQSISSSFDLIAPLEELREAQATSRAAGRRLGIVGGEAAALLFAFALLAAMTLRADLAAARRRLAWYGARGWQLALVTVAESGALALVGTAIGLVVAVVAGALVAERAGAPAAAVLERSVLSVEGLGLALLVAAAATAVLVATVAARPARFGRSRFSPLDGAALVAIGLVALELGRGDGDGELVLSRTRARHLRRRGARREDPAARVAAARAVDQGPLDRLPARLALARAQPRLRRRRNGVPRRQLRAGALRRELPSHARARRARPGGAPRAARLRRAGGPAPLDPGPGRRPARALPRARRRGGAGAATDRRRQPTRGRERDHAARPSARRAPGAARLARERCQPVARAARTTARGVGRAERATAPARARAPAAADDERSDSPLGRDRGADRSVRACPVRRGRFRRRAAAAGWPGS